MEVPNDVVAKLSAAWLAEAKRLRLRAICDCGCGQSVSVARARFRPGHDAKLRKIYTAKIREILKSR
jgi:hypothetical protein